MRHEKNPLYRAWRRALGRDWLHQEMRLLRLKCLPRRVVCLALQHNWGEKNPVLTVGPLGASPRERDYYVMGFHEQCERCYAIRDVPYTVFEKLAAIEEAIREDEQDWPVVKKVFG